MVVFEVDFKEVADAFLSSYLDTSEFGNIICDCKRILSDNVSFSVHFVRPQANEIAHTLARASCFHGSPSTWFLPHLTISLLLGKMCTMLHH